MAIVRVIRAGPNDTLCGIAVDNGFRNCRKLRDANPSLANRSLQAGDLVNVPEVTQRTENGQTEQVHPFKVFGRPMASIRFVHGTPDRPPEQDPTISILNVSNYVTDRAGAPDGSAAFPNESVRTFEANADRDIDAFKIEVHDERTNDTDLQVDLEALRPVYDPADPDGRRVLRHEQFSGAERPRRSLLHTGPDNLLASRQGASKRFRTCYLRLVVDESDKGARSQQTLLTTDMTDEGDPQVEILDQVARATYLLSTCPAAGDAQCRATVQVPIGTDRRRLRVAVHVLRRTVGGAAIVSLNDARRRIRRWVRRMYAQASIAPQLLQVREVDPVENLVSVSNDSGVTAAGDGQLSFRINAAGKPSQVIGPITPAAGQRPIATANALAALVRAPYSARATLNPPRFPDAIGSADLVITEESGAHVTIDNVVSNDSRQTLTVGRANPLNLQSWDGNNFLVGSLQQRTVLKNYDTGADRIDLFIVQRVTAGNRGEAMMSGHRVNAAKRAIDAVKWSAFLAQRTADGSDNNPFSMPHEMGHVAMELIHATGAGSATQLMTGAGTSAANQVGGSKRIRDGNVTFDTPAVSTNQIRDLRSEGAPLLEGW